MSFCCFETEVIRVLNFLTPNPFLPEKFDSWSRASAENFQGGEGNKKNQSRGGGSQRKKTEK